MNRLKNSILLLMMIFAIGFASCSKSDENEDEPTLLKIESNLVDGYYYNKYKSNESIRFFKDHTFQWMTRNEFDKYDQDSEGVYSGVWTIENESDVVLKWEHDYAPNKKAPTLMLHISFIDGKMAFTDQLGANCLYTNGDVSTFIDQEMVGRTFKAGNSYTYGGIKLKNTQILVFKEDGDADWMLEERFFENDVVRHQYSATGKTWRNVSGTEIYIEWFYKGEGNATYHEVVSPPQRMTNLEFKKNDKGEWLLYFENGYDYLSNTNYVRK